jgi:3-methyladenine DNA glycosylase AlkD
MKMKEALDRLKALGSDKVRAQNRRNGAGDQQFGVKLGDIRKVAKEIKANHALALQLWDTGNLDARLLAILLMKPKAISAERMDQMVRSNDQVQVSDWLNAYVIKAHPEKERLRQEWMANHPMAARAGWSLTAERIGKNPDGLDLSALLDRIEREMTDAASEPQWTMNAALASIGTHHPAYRARALAIGEAVGAYRNYPTSPGCTSPFAPIWINEMVRRQAVPG